MTATSPEAAADEVVGVAASGDDGAAFGFDTAPAPLALPVGFVAAAGFDAPAAGFDAAAFAFDGGAARGRGGFDDGVLDGSVGLESAIGHSS